MLQHKQFLFQLYAKISMYTYSSVEFFAYLYVV